LFQRGTSPEQAADKRGFGTGILFFIPLYCRSSIEIKNLNIKGGIKGGFRKTWFNLYFY